MSKCFVCGKTDAFGPVGSSKWLIPRLHDRNQPAETVAIVTCSDQCWNNLVDNRNIVMRDGQAYLTATGYKYLEDSR